MKFGSGFCQPSTWLPYSVLGCCPRAIVCLYFAYFSLPMYEPWLSSLLSLLSLCNQGLSRAWEITSYVQRQQWIWLRLDSDVGLVWRDFWSMQCLLTASDCRMQLDQEKLCLFSSFCSKPVCVAHLRQAQLWDLEDQELLQINISINLSGHIPENGGCSYNNGNVLYYLAPTW